MPVAYLIARAHGVNILEVGTQNPGAANVFRTVSRPMGALVLLLDALKGFLAVAVADSFGVSDEVAMLAGAAAVVGHWYPIFLRFRGGTGLATAIGVGLGLAPFAGLIGLALGLLALLIVRNTGQAAGIGYTGFLFLCLFLDIAWAATFGATLLGVIVLLREIVTHRLQHRGSV